MGMPKRVIDFEAMWASDKLAACAVWARREYAWLYGLADCSGSFELSNLRVVWGKVRPTRRRPRLRRPGHQSARRTHSLWPGAQISEFPRGRNFSVRFLRLRQQL